MDISDALLVKRCLEGDTQAFSGLVKRYKKLIYNIIYNIIYNKDEVNDIAQEVFIRIYKSLDKYNPQYKFSTWCAKIATNYCYDVLKKKRVECVPIEDAYGLHSEADTPEDSYIKREQRDRINNEIMNLPEKYRILLILYHKNGLSYEEMSQVLDEPMSIIKNRIYRARKMLKDKLASGRKEGIT
ncbi:sigma-70 family RNA polymerase sigma factor [Acetivibrio saccincola]|uniref:ECF RNA polymerase sigma factor SigW n=1 Tax=Acetivibrio saccincola TaxID=1677857 RepID=A0A2K9E9Z1_9FIRM|nr:sigma-70 family RNA polymerase sigma factor [Acetivibrio saccincola]AUG58496.1 ECF RNA polymerase sigma factor SigW [Acetivibrio saccincola]NLW27222.1 sigma-70 family RNA polymerase sigma factor [Acetivibrio saccincola]PQQ66303.1 RNA polymerase subunit sigma-24 [Acetivibrio saccincola]HQD28639.1 sigma-70 family RNA polymerase sigma factor [Acetivibrio saccincola]